MDKYAEVKKWIFKLAEINRNDISRASKAEDLQFLKGESMAYRLIIEKMKRDIDNIDD